MVADRASEFEQDLDQEREMQDQSRALSGDRGEQQQPRYSQADEPSFHERSSEAVRRRSSAAGIPSETHMGVENAKGQGQKASQILEWVGLRLRCAGRRRWNTYRTWLEFDAHSEHELVGVVFRVEA